MQKNFESDIALQEMVNEAGNCLQASITEVQDQQELRLPCPCPVQTCAAYGVELHRSCRGQSRPICTSNLSSRMHDRPPYLINPPANSIRPRSQPIISQTQTR
jgi:hypothetical protein